MARQYARPSGVFGRFVMAPLLNRINAHSNAAVFDALALDGHCRVLEIGFGGGDLLLKIASRMTEGTVHGLELSHSMLQRVQARTRAADLDSRIRLHHGSVESLPFTAREFDRVCCVNTLYFWTDLEKSFGEIARVTDVGGLLVLGFGSHTAMGEAGYNVDEFHLHTPEAVSLALENAGYTGEHRTTLNPNKRRTFHIFSATRAA